MKGGQNCIMGIFMIGGPSEILLENQIKEDEMGGTCCTHGGKEKIELAFVGKREEMSSLEGNGCKRRLY